MRKFLTLLALLSPIAFAQDVTGVEQAIQFIFRPPAVVLTVTAVSGDGTVCTLAKLAGPVINAYLNCTGANGSVKGISLTASGTTAVPTVLQQGDVLCLFLANPGPAVIPAQGSMLAIPAVSIGWQCSTNIRTAGVVTGNTPLVNGSVTWP